MEKKPLPLDELRKFTADDYRDCMFAARMEQEGLLKAPENLKESILLQSQSPAVLAERTLYQTSKRLSLFYYSLKVSFAVLSMLFFLFAGNFFLDLTRSPVPSSPPAQTTWAQQLSQQARNAGEKLQNFSENLMTLEVFDYDK